MTSGPRLASQSSAAMFQLLSRMLRMLVLLALFPGGAMSHELGAGIEMKSGSAFTHGVNAADDPSHGHSYGCSACVDQNSPCCMLGHCLVGLPALVEALVADSTGHPTSQPVEVLIQSLVDVPFRPPAVM
jgi:hypothetical protein